MSEQKMDGLYCTEEDIRRAGVTKCGKTPGRQRMTLNDIAADRQQWRTWRRHQWNQLDDDYL